jgi:hypothetical protein
MSIISQHNWCYESQSSEALFGAYEGKRCQPKGAIITVTNESLKKFKALSKITPYLFFGLVKGEMKTNGTVCLGSSLRLVYDAKDIILIAETFPV